jgi:phosphoglycerol transferase MdoB-like AlkP superfamily enzyme
MSTTRRLELISGVASGILGIIVILSASTLSQHSSYLGVFVLWVVPEMFVAAGAYLHAVKNSSRGRLMLLIAGIVPALLTLQNIVFFGELAYVVGATAFLLLATGGMVILTMTLSFMSPKSK